MAGRELIIKWISSFGKMPNGGFSSPLARESVIK